MKIRIFLSLLTVMLFSPNTRATNLVGEAVDLTTGAPLYTEVHTFSALDGEQPSMASSYLTPDNELIASRVVRFDKSQKVSEYRLQIAASGYRESIVRDQESLTFQIEEAGLAPIREVLKLARDKTPIIDAGMNNLILRNWDALIQGKRLRFEFASTAQLGLVKLQVKHDKSLSDDQMTVFTMTAANPLIRLLIAPIKVGFYQHSKQLAYYRGISNLKNEQGDAFRVEITFEDNQISSADQIAQF